MLRLTLEVCRKLCAQSRAHRHTSVVLSRSDQMDLLCCCCGNRQQTRHLLSPKSTISTVVLDLQCFKNNRNEFIVKEACVMDIGSGTILLHHVAELSFDQYRFLSKEKQRENRWLTKYYHGLDWNIGDISYHELVDRLFECLAQCSVIYVKGTEKKTFVMKNLIPAPRGVDEVDSLLTSTKSIYSPPLVIDMTDIGCGSILKINNSALLSVSKVRCNQHKSARHWCALSNCTLLLNWLLATANVTE